MIFIVAACLLWAFDTLMRYPLMSEGFTSFSIVFFEHLFALSVLVLFFFKEWRSVLKKQSLFSFFIVGGLGSALSTLAFTQSFKFLNPSLVILLQKLQPIFAIILAGFVLKERIQKSFVLWALISIFGAILISFDDLQVYFSSTSFTWSDLTKENKIIGYFYVFISVSGWGGATVYGRKLITEGHSSRSIMLGRFLWGTLILLPLWLLSEAGVLQVGSLEAIDIDSTFLLRIALLALLSGLIALQLYYKGLKKTPARIATLLELFFPLFAVWVNWIFLNQTLNIYQWLGGFLLVLSSTVLQIKKY